MKCATHAFGNLSLPLLWLQLAVGFVLIVSSYSTSAKANTVSCDHFWVSRGHTLIKSGKVVGQDPGASPYNAGGVYRCTALLTSNSVRNDYLYIGEVGDSSNIVFDEVPKNLAPVPPILHGLDPDGIKNSQDLRAFPFVIPVAYFFSEPGLYSFSINYQNLIAGQSGIRSGPPAILNASNLLFRTLHDYKGELFYLLEAIVAIGIIPFLFFGIKNSPLHASVIGGICLLTSSLFFSFSSIPKTLMDPVVATRIHDFLILLVTFIGNCALLMFYQIRNRTHMKTVFTIHFSVNLTLVAFLLYPGFSVQTWFYLEGLALFWAGTILPLLLCYEILKGNLANRVDPNLKNQTVVLWLSAKSIIMAWDASNFLLFEGRFPFLSGKFYFSITIFLLIFLKIKNTISEVNFRRDISSIRTDLLRILSSHSVEDSSVLNKFAAHVAQVCSASRVSISEILPGSKMRLVGKYGDYKNLEDSFLFDDQSISFNAAKTSKVQFATFSTNKRFSNHKELSSDCVVIPLRNAEDLPGILALTGFFKGIFPPFISERIQILQSECEILFHLMKAERDSRSKARLITSTRLKVHPLQLESESHFLENFEISSKLEEPTFIFGDVVDSVSLNEMFGGETLRAVVDAQLSEIFEENKEMGIIISRDKGDSVSIIIPNQATDVSSKESALRGVKVLNSIKALSSSWPALGRSKGLPIPINYRFVLSGGGITIKKPLDPVGNFGITSFALLADSTIDEASRIISTICAPGEYLLTENIVRKLENSLHNVVELSPTRLKGKNMSTKVYSLTNALSKKEIA